MTITDQGPDAHAGNRARLHEGVLGKAMIADLLDYACRREVDFQPARVYRRDQRDAARDTAARDCMRLTDLGPFQSILIDAITARAPDAIAAFGLTEPALTAREVELCAYGDGGRFQAHVDVVPAPARVRVLTCIYYFSAQPQVFTGGALRVFPWPGATDQQVFDIAPACDRLVMFPSFLRHEVRPVALASEAWRDRRFNLTCWLCRPKDAMSPR